MKELQSADVEQIEKDIRELTGLTEKPDEPVFLDLESVRILEPGKFELDIVSLFSKNRPLIYKLGEGKYIIDLASSLGTKKMDKKIIDKEIYKNFICLYCNFYGCYGIYVKERVSCKEQQKLRSEGKFRIVLHSFK